MRRCARASHPRRAMVMLEIPRDAAVLVSPGGRLRVLAPRDTPLPASKKLMSLDDQRSYVYLPGYKVTHDMGPNTQAPTLLFRGPLDGTNWEELHDDLCKTESRAKNRAARAEAVFVRRHRRVLLLCLLL